MFQRRLEPDTSVRRKSRSPPSSARDLTRTRNRGDNTNVTMHEVVPELDLEASRLEI